MVKPKRTKPDYSISKRTLNNLIRILDRMPHLFDLIP